MSNSSLVSHIRISPNRTVNRRHKIDTITIHCVVGQCSVETLGEIFSKPSKKASSNYGIGFDGRVGMYVEEKDRSWCSSNSANDNRAITIECASDMTEPYAINDAVYKTLIKLCADICRRNGILELKWKGDKNLIGQVDKQNMTVHRWFAAKSCPGDYIYSRLGRIADEVNELLGVHQNEPKMYRVQTGAFKNLSYAKNYSYRLHTYGYEETYLVKVGGLYKVQIGAFVNRSYAEAMASKLRKQNFDCFITTETGEPVHE